MHYYLRYTDPTLFCQRGGYVEGSRMAKAISDLSQSQFLELVQLCDPAEDNLIDVDGEGCVINHGNVGTRGIEYYWSI